MQIKNYALLVATGFASFTLADFPHEIGEISATDLITKAYIDHNTHKLVLEHPDGTTETSELQRRSYDFGGT